MRILVMSDTHGYLADCLSVMEHCIDDVDVIIHLGDGASDFEKAQTIFPDKLSIGISGNCDYNSNLPTEREISLGEKEFFITHGSNYNVKRTMLELSIVAKNNNVDICLFGHTHKPSFSQEENIIFINPGSVSKGFLGICTYCIINLDKNVTVDFYNSKTFKKMII